MKKIYKAVTFKGLENILFEELKTMGAENLKLMPKTVSFKGNKELLYKANLSIRTALKIIMPIKRIKLNNPEEIYKIAFNIAWENYFTLNNTFSVSTVGYSSFYKNLNYASLKVKDAIADRFRKKYNKRPSVNPKNPDIGIHVYIKENLLEISLDSGGKSLHRRGYRLQGHKAPLNEILAASLINISNWNENTPLYDFMCGSGTILFEAYLKANKIPPNIKRKKFSFMNWKDYSPELFKKTKNELKNKITINRNLKLFANDINKNHINLFKKELEHYQIKDFENTFEFSAKDYKEIKSKTNYGTIIINPPYGERLQENENFYHNLGIHLKNNFKGHSFWILTPNIGGLKKIKMKPSKKYTLYNGGLEVRFQNYEIRI